MILVLILDVGREKLEIPEEKPARKSLRGQLGGADKVKHLLNFFHGEPFKTEGLVPDQQ